MKYNALRITILDKNGELLLSMNSQADPRILSREIMDVVNSHLERVD